MSDLGQWLNDLGLGQYAELFAANDVDREILSEITEHDLEKLGVSLGHRKKLLRAIAVLFPESPEPAGQSGEAYKVLSQDRHHAVGYVCPSICTFVGE